MPGPDRLAGPDDSPESMAANDAGLAAYERGDLEAAERHLRLADQLGGRAGAFRLGYLLNERGDYPGAAQAYRRAIERGSPDAAKNLGIMLQEQADLDGARAAFEAGVALGDPTSMRLLTSMGYTVVASDEGVSSTAGTTSDMVVTMAQQAYHAGALSPQAYETDLRGVIDRDQGSAGDLARAALARLSGGTGGLGRSRTAVSRGGRRRPCRAAVPCRLGTEPGQPFARTATI